jgi:ribonuclease HI/Zn finger protein HypA/HybF involved in hydrogenase expression
MRIVLTWLQLNAGTSIPILESRQRLDYIPTNWFMSIKDFIHKIDATITIKNLWSVKPQRTNDLVLMDIVDGLEVSTTIKRIFNNWRIYFRVNLLSEISNTKGTHVMGKFLSKYNVKEYMPTSTLQWPNQPHPDLKYFTIWINILRQITGIDTRGKLPVRRQMGRWLSQSTNNVPTNVNFLINKNNQTLAVRDTSTKLWSTHLLTHQQRSTYFFDKNNSLEMPHINENEYDRADAVELDDHYKINKRNIKSLCKIPILSTGENDTNLEKFIRNKQLWHADLTKNVIVLDENNLTTGQSQQLKISTDGGAAGGKGSMGVVISMEEKILLENKSRIPPIYNDIHSYRSEGMGILCGLVIAETIVLYNTAKNMDYPKSYIVESDSKSMVDKISKIRHWKITQRMCKDKDMDVVIEITTTLRRLNKKGVSIEFKHIKGHQDRSDKPINTSTRMNIRADNIATEGLQLRNIPKNINLPSDNAIFCIKGKQITSHRTKTIRNAHQSMNLREYMKKANNWKEDQIEKIWWKIHEKSLLNISEGKRLIIQKSLHNQLPCNERTIVMYEYKPPYCSLCINVVEDQAHVLRCPKCPSRSILRKKFKKDLHRYLTNSQVNSTTSRVLTFTLNAWLDKNQLPKLNELAPDASQHLKQAYNFQSTIGWEQMFRGRFDIAWGEMYNHDCTMQKTYPQARHMDAETWGSKLLNIIWEFVLESWFARNETEHNLNNNKTEISKRKLVEQILWLKQKINSKTEHPYKDTNDMTLMKLPVNNLNIMVEQIENIYERDRLNPENYDVS